jgi:hypothetical protein
MYPPSIWPGLPPPKAPNSRTSLTLVNGHTSILHFLAPFAARLKQEDMLMGMLNLRALEIALNAALRRQRPSRLHCRHRTPLASLAIQGLRNAPFHGLMFGVNELLLDGKTGFWSKRPVFGSICATGQKSRTKAKLRHFYRKRVFRPSAD